MIDERYRLLVFDWDGTLVDSIERIVTSLQFASRQVCGRQLGEDSARGVIGLGLREAILHLHPQLDDTGIERFADSYRQHFLFDSTVPERLFDGVADMLARLADDDYTLAVATGKSRKGLDRAMHTHSIGHFFSTTRCADENRSKPHPEMLNSILHELEIPATETVMIGDSAHDMIMAVNAGVDAIGVTHGVEEADSLMAHNVLTCLDNITDLYDFLSHNMSKSID